ncbi:MAG: hypothetical protein QNJ34_27325 [Xenococcaceae cyanobacterium MO_188.B29]|nr:hypothetical protein [Xenococcaceae cyanobacterium MO_188.B29]
MSQIGSVNREKNLAWAVKRFVEWTIDNGQLTIDNEYFKGLCDNEIISVSAYPELRLNQG